MKKPRRGVAGGGGAKFIARACEMRVNGKPTDTISKSPARERPPHVRAHPPEESTTKEGAGIDGKPPMKRRAAKLVSVSNTRQDRRRIQCRTQLHCWRSAPAWR